MAVKDVYKIPYGLDSSYGDMEITLKAKDGGLGTKPLPVKVVMSYLLSIVVCWWIVSNTIVGSGTVVQILIFIALWALLTIVLLKHDATKRMQIELIMTLLNYLPKSARQVITRSSASAMGYYQIMGVKKIDKRTGLVEYSDGTFGYWYRVVGCASVLLFESDRKAIINRVDSFYQKMNTECEVVFVTTKSAQPVYRQVANLQRRYKALDVKDEELMAVANEQFRCLKNYVGTEFKSIHQYMVLKAENKETLIQAKNILQSEIENSTLMIKRCVPMFYDDIIPVLEQIYKGKGR